MVRLVSLVALGFAVSTACASGGTGGGGGESVRGADAGLVAATCEGSAEVEVGQIEPDPVEKGASALLNPTDEDFPTPLVEPSDLVSGGPPPDGIPAVDEPKFVRQCSVDWLTASDPVLVIEIGHDTRAYPLRIMTWHEIVNDTVAGRPVTVTYCPLCNSGIAYERQAAGRVLDFGTSGLLLHSSLVMYDRQTQSLWSHFTATAVAGRLTGTELETIPLQTVAFSDLRAAHPEALVLSADTGFDRDYGTNPYVGYDDPTSSPLLFSGDVDPGLPEMTRVVGVAEGGQAVAVVSEELLKRRVVEFELAGREVVALAKPGTASALDSSAISRGRDVGATGVFVAETDDRALTFRPTTGGFQDEETGSSWNILGEATGGPLTGAQLERIEHIDTFWFAWQAFHADTGVVASD